MRFSEGTNHALYCFFENRCLIGYNFSLSGGTMKSLQYFLITAFMIVLFVSCSKPSAQGPVGQTPLPGPAAPEAKAGWEVEWQKTLTEARREGRVVVYGPPGADTRQALTEGFKKAYPFITVEYVGATGAAQVAKVKAEHRAGLFIVDLIVSGTTTITAGLLDVSLPVEPVLLLPEVRDGKNWLDGKLHYADKAGKYNLVFSTRILQALVHNTNLMDAKRIQELSYWDLTKPEFKGKIITRDPWTSGPGQSAAMFYYVNPQLGVDFIRALGKNDVLITRDDRQVIEWVSLGRSIVGLAPSTPAITEFILKGGFPNVKPRAYLKDGAMSTAGFGSLALPQNYPHPNATKVYVNWLLSKEGQLAWSTATGTPSRRIDVPTDFLDQEVLLKPGINYINTYSEEFQDNREKMMPLIFEVFGRG